jgi:hypothetical protein
MRERLVAVNGAELWVVEQGNGIPVVELNSAGE